MSFWRTFAGAMCGARIHANGELGDHTSMDAQDVGSSLLLYPNPADDLIHISSMDGDTPGPVEIFTSEGKCIWQDKGINDRAAVDISGWASGLFAVHARTANGALVKRFMKH